MSTDGKGTKGHRKIAENFNRLSRVHNVTDDRQTDRQTGRQTDGRATSYSEREREFTFAKTFFFFGRTSETVEGRLQPQGTATVTYNALSRYLASCYWFLGGRSCWTIA